MRASTKRYLTTAVLAIALVAMTAIAGGGTTAARDVSHGWDLDREARARDSLAGLRQRRERDLLRQDLRREERALQREERLLRARLRREERAFMRRQPQGAGWARPSAEWRQLRRQEREELRRHRREERERLRSTFMGRARRLRW